MNISVLIYIYNFSLGVYDNRLKVGLISDVLVDTIGGDPGLTICAEIFNREMYSGCFDVFDTFFMI